MIEKKEKRQQRTTKGKVSRCPTFANNKKSRQRTHARPSIRPNVRDCILAYLNYYQHHTQATTHEMTIKVVKMKVFCCVLHIKMIQHICKFCSCLISFFLVEFSAAQMKQKKRIVHEERGIKFYDDNYIWMNNEVAYKNCKKHNNLNSNRNKWIMCVPYCVCALDT